MMSKKEVKVLQHEPKSKRKILDYIIDLGLIICFMVFLFQFGKFYGRDDAYIAGFIDGYDFYYKSAYNALVDSLKGGGIYEDFLDDSLSH